MELKVVKCKKLFNKPRTEFKLLSCLSPVLIRFQLTTLPLFVKLFWSRASNIPETLMSRGKWVRYAPRCTHTLLDAVNSHLLWCPKRLEKQKGWKKCAPWGYTWLFLLGLSLVPINTRAAQTGPLQPHSRTTPYHYLLQLSPTSF